MVEAPDGGTFLVHYQLQMGDDGIESTLLYHCLTDDEVLAPLTDDNDLSRIGVERAMDAADTRRNPQSIKRARGDARE